MGPERTEPQVSFAHGTETGPGGPHNGQVVQQMVKVFPAAHAVGAFHPHIGRIHTAVVFVALLVEGFHHHPGIFPIVGQHVAAFLFAHGRHGGFRPSLDNVVHPVELGGLPAEPHFVQAHFVAIRRFPGQLERHHSIAAAGTGESCGLGEGAEFDGAVLGAGDGIDAPGHFRIGDEGFVSGIIQDDGVIFQGIVHPGLQLFLVVGCPGGVVGGTQIDDVRLHRRIRHGQEIVFRGPVHVQDLPVPHHIGVHIHRVNRIRNQDHIAVIEQVGNVPAVAFGPVADEDFLGFQFHPMAGIVFGNGFVKEFISLFRTVTPEGFLVAHFLYRLGHGFHNGRSQGQRHIPDTHFDQFFVRMGFRKSLDPCSNIRKQIAFL